MPNIKVTGTVSGTIKTADRTIKRLDRTVREGVRDIKGAAGQAGITQDTGDSPDAAPARVLEYAEMQAGMYAGRTLLRAGGKTARGTIRSVREPFRVKRRIQTAGRQAQAAKDAAKTAGKTIKESAHTIKTAAHGAKQGIHAAVKTGQATIKTAQATVKTAQAAAKTAQAAAQASAQAARAAAQAARVSAQAAAHAVRATAHAVAAAVKAIAAGIKALASAIAAGGWVAVAIVLVIVVLIAIIATAIGIFAANDTAGRSLESVQQDTAAIFSERLAEQEGYMEGYDKVVISPAPQITEWNNIIAVYSVRAQHEGEVAIEMTDDAVELLQETAWDMISFEPSYQELSYTQTDESGNESTRTIKIGIITVEYKSPADMAVQYGFTTDETELLLSLADTDAFGSGLKLFGGGAFDNPVPAGSFVLGDYPTKDGTTYHPGRDIAAQAGTPVLAAADGTVTQAGDGSIVIDHGNGYRTVYTHCSNIAVAAEQAVTKGQQIAAVGEPPEGEAGEPHLHFELRTGDDPLMDTIDPLKEMK